MTDDTVKEICQAWAQAGYGDECFWEGWPECPTQEEILTPNMVLACISAQAAEIERLAKDKRWIIDERDRTFALMLSRAEDAEAEIERLRGDLAKAVESLQGVRAFVRSLAPYADQGHSLAPELERACATLADLTGGQKDGN